MKCIVIVSLSGTFTTKSKGILGRKTTKTNRQKFTGVSKFRLSNERRKSEISVNSYYLLNISIILWDFTSTKLNNAYFWVSEKNNNSGRSWTHVQEATFKLYQSQWFFHWPQNKRWFNFVLVSNGASLYTFYTNASEQLSMFLVKIVPLFNV